MKKYGYILIILMLSPCFACPAFSKRKNIQCESISQKAQKIIQSDYSTMSQIAADCDSLYFIESNKRVVKLSIPDLMRVEETDLPENFIPFSLMLIGQCNDPQKRVIVYSQNKVDTSMIFSAIFTNKLVQNGLHKGFATLTSLTTIKPELNEIIIPSQRSQKYITSLNKKSDKNCSDINFPQEQNVVLEYLSNGLTANSCGSLFVLYNDSNQIGKYGLSSTESPDGDEELSLIKQVSINKNSSLDLTPLNIFIAGNCGENETLLLFSERNSTKEVILQSYDLELNLIGTKVLSTKTIF